MACQTIPDLPSSSAVLTGAEFAPISDAAEVMRKARTSAIAQSATTWSATTQYVEGTIVQFQGDNFYRAVQNNLNQEPPENPANWKVVLAPVGFTMEVPGVHTTLITAMEYLDEAILSDGVVIQVDDGAYNYTTTQIDVAHPYGKFITIQGNTATPASCSLSFAALPNSPSSPYLNSDSGSIYASGPSGVTINGFSILKSGGAPAFGHCGILASDGAIINVSADTIVNGFYADLAALDGGVINAVGVDLVTVSGAFALLADNGTVNAPTSAITGTGGAIATRRNGYVRMNDSTVDAAIVTAVTMESGTAVLTSTAIGNVDVLYEVTGSNNNVSDVGATFGTASVHEIGLTGTLDYNGAIVTASAQTFEIGDINANTLQRITSSASPADKVYISSTGLSSVTQDLSIAADGNVGLTVDATTGGALIPISLTIGTTTAHTGMEGGTGALNGSGVLTETAAWVTANTIIVPAFISGTPAGTRLAPVITPGVSFTLTSDGGAADSGVNVSWIAIVYP